MKKATFPRTTLTLINSNVVADVFSVVGIAIIILILGITG